MFVCTVYYARADSRYQVLKSFDKNGADKNRT